MRDDLTSFDCVKQCNKQQLADLFPALMLMTLRSKILYRVLYIIPLLRLTFLMFFFSTPWKYQKFFWFSDVFWECSQRKLGWNVLLCRKWSKLTALDLFINLLCTFSKFRELILLNVLIISRTRFRVNLLSIVAWMLRNSLPETGTTYEIWMTVTELEPAII